MMRLLAATGVFLLLSGMTWAKQPPEPPYVLKILRSIEFLDDAPPELPSGISKRKDRTESSTPPSVKPQPERKESP